MKLNAMKQTTDESARRHPGIGTVGLGGPVVMVVRSTGRNARSYRNHFTAHCQLGVGAITSTEDQSKPFTIILCGALAAIRLPFLTWLVVSSLMIRNPPATPSASVILWRPVSKHPIQKVVEAAFCFGWLAAVFGFQRAIVHRYRLRRNRLRGCGGPIPSQWICFSIVRDILSVSARDLPTWRPAPICRTAGCFSRAIRFPADK